MRLTLLAATLALCSHAFADDLPPHARTIVEIADRMAAEWNRAHGPQAFRLAVASFRDNGPKTVKSDFRDFVRDAQFEAAVKAFRESDELAKLFPYETGSRTLTSPTLPSSRDTLESFALIPMIARESDLQDDIAAAAVDTLFLHHIQYALAVAIQDEAPSRRQADADDDALTRAVRQSHWVPTATLATLLCTGLDRDIAETQVKPLAQARPPSMVEFELVLYERRAAAFLADRGLAADSAEGRTLVEYARFLRTSAESGLGYDDPKPPAALDAEIARLDPIANGALRAPFGRLRRAAAEDAVFHATEYAVAWLAKDPRTTGDIDITQNPEFIDPFTGRAMIVKKSGELLIYSTGPDQTDNGGTFAFDPHTPRPRELKGPLPATSLANQTRGYDIGLKAR